MTEYTFDFCCICYLRVLQCLYLQFQFVHEEALACELAAYFHLEIGDLNNSVEYCLQAHEKYQEWVRLNSVWRSCVV